MIQAALKLNNNMRCFEIILWRYIHMLSTLLNNNMRCFEMKKEWIYKQDVGMLNNNMRCFEIPVITLVKIS